MKELSVFVDESGDFGVYQKHSPYYIVSMVFHNQSNDISEELSRLDSEFKLLGYNNPMVHTRPLIRHEDEYFNMSPNERRAILTKLFYFAKRCNVKYKSFVYEKRKFANEFELQSKIARDIAGLIFNNQSFFYSFDKVILYYDNGQHELTKALNIVFSTNLVNYEMRQAMQKDYRLSQVADLICTMEQIRFNLDNGIELTVSEKLLFHDKRSIKKDFLKPLSKLDFHNQNN